MLEGLTMTETSETGIWDVDNTAYHADCDCVSHSALEDFRSSAKRYFLRYVEQSLPRKLPTKEMQLGSALHVKLLEPERWEQLIAIAPDVDRRSKNGKAEWEAFLVGSNGRIGIDEEQCALSDAMAESVQAHDTAPNLLSAEGRNELAIRWVDPVTGVLCKAKFDRLLDSGVIVDLKSASDPSPEGWARSAAQYGYHRQTAWYESGAEDIFHSNYIRLHIVVGTEGPHEVAVYELDEGSIKLGRDQNAVNLRRLAECRKSGRWMHSWNQGIARVAVSRWAFTQES